MMLCPRTSYAALLGVPLARSRGR
uniref:Uncharacterized protein n=1 Tax=Arundo donax TaxID=35708 RepID=A0A0A8XZ57_ARUDO